MKIFVPGRICLFGEHSDWAGGYRRINGEIEKGYTIITGTNQGIHAEIKPHPSKLIVTGTLDNGAKEGPWEVPMDRDILLAEAERGGFFSYVAGVAYQVMTHYRVRGLEIDNYQTDLPIKKGLSSSAAICVLVARAFNRTYDLKMTTRGEMEFAYMGEIMTPSRCGRMDQGCAYGNRPILMTFDGERIDVREIALKSDLHYVVVDLRAGKDTREILNRLNHCFPFAETEVQKGVQEYLGPINRGIVEEALVAIEGGDAKRLGALMTQAQAEFDRHVQPACPSQLTSPVLHKVLAHPAIQPLVFGGKGVGSQGDGSAQFLARDAESQEKLAATIERELGMPCLKLVLGSGRRVRKALIPAAGFGTRLFPASKAVKKELFPVIDKEGRAKPAIMTIVEEAIEAGIEEVAIIVQKEDRALFEDFFCCPPAIEHFNKLSRENQQYMQYLMNIGHRITFLEQDRQDGFGHAVFSAREWIGDEPFLLMLGDHLYASDSDRSCAQQLLQVFERHGHSVVGLKVTPGDVVQHFGCVGGSFGEQESIVSISEFVEKPDLDYARKHLHIVGMGDDQFLSVFGIYVLTPRVFDYLEENIAHNIRERGEYQLTSCLDQVRQHDGFSGYVVKGRRFDIGLPDSYRQTVIDFRNA